MSTENTEIENALALSVKAIFPSTTVIQANQDGPEPPGTYIYILPIGIYHVGRSQASTLTDDDEKLLIRQEYEVDVRFGFIGPNAGNLAMDFSAALQNVYYFEQWQKNNLSLRDRKSVMRVPTVRETRFTNHYTMSAKFGFATQTIQPIPVIDYVTLNGVVISNLP